MRPRALMAPHNSEEAGGQLESTTCTKRTHKPPPLRSTARVAASNSCNYRERKRREAGRQCVHAVARDTADRTTGMEPPGRHHLRRRVRGTTSSSGMDEAIIPLLVRVLAGNPVTGANILACLATPDARRLRRLHPAVAVVVANVPWADTDTPAVDVVRLRAALPAAVVTWRPKNAVSPRTLRRAAAALEGAPRLWLSLMNCEDATGNAILSRLPVSLHTLTLRAHFTLTIDTSDTSLAHLTALVSLTLAAEFIAVHLLPPSLQELHAKHCNLLSPPCALQTMRALRSLSCSWLLCSINDLAYLPSSLEELELGKADDIAGFSLARLTRLRVLRVWGFTIINDKTVASLPPSLETLCAPWTAKLSATASFVHLPALHDLNVCGSGIGAASLASLPPSLVSLNVASCLALPGTAVLPHLPALRVVDASGSGIGNALVASLPACLHELHLFGCPRVTHDASLDHLPALRQLHGSDTDLSPESLNACRARGCIAPADGVLRGPRGIVSAMALLPDGRLACAHWGGAVVAWDPLRGGDTTEMLPEREDVVYHDMVALHDGRGLAVGKGDTIEVWDVSRAPAVLRTTIACGQSVCALAALHDGRLAAGCYKGGILVVDVERGAVAPVMVGHNDIVRVVAVMPDGRLASGSDDTTVRVWDTSTRQCVATLTGHTGGVSMLVALAGGQLASASSGDDTVRLWDVGALTSVVLLDPLMTGTRDLVALVPLPDGRLAAGSRNGGIWVWNTRPDAIASGTHAAGAVPTVVLSWHAATALVALPDGRLASADYHDRDTYTWRAAPHIVVRLWLPPPPPPLPH